MDTLDTPPLPPHALRRPWTDSLLALVGYVLLIGAFYAPVVVGRQSLAAGDFTDHFFPFSLFLRSELLAGRLPLWNPFTYAGHPFLADIQAGVFYPISTALLGLTLPFGSDAARLYILQIEALLQVVLAGFFTYLLLKALTGRPLAAFLAGGVFALSGYLTGYPALQLAILRVAIWLPLVLWLLLHAFDRPQRWRWWVAAALAYAVAFLAGHPQTFLHLSYAVLAWIALLLIKERRSRPQGMSFSGFLVRIGLFYALAAGLAAAQLLPSVEFTRLSVRASAAYDFLSGGFPLKDTWQVLLPRLLSYFSPLYAGIAALGLAVVAVVQAFAEPASARRTSAVRSPADLRLFVAFFFLLTVVALLVSYGRNAFLYPVFYRWLPGWNLFQGQERAAYLVAFGLSALAGFGGAAIDAVSSRTRRLATAVFALLCAAGIAVFLWQTRANASPPAIPAPVGQAALAALLALALFVAVLWPNRLARWRLGLVAALALTQLFLANRGVNTADVPLAEQAALPPEAVAVQQAVEEQGAIDAAVGSLSYQGPPGRVFNEYRVFEDYGVQVGVEDLWGSSPLRLSRLAALWQQLPRERLWQLLGVQHVLSYPPALSQPSEPLAEFPGSDGPTYLHRLAQVHPRAWVVQRVQRVDDSVGLGFLGDGGFDLATTALLPAFSLAGNDDAVLPDGLLASPGQNTVRMQQLAPGRLRLDVQSEHGGLLVVAENWMPGWKATIRHGPDQPATPAPVLRADLALLGVPIGPGQSTVALEYRPASVSVGIAISLVTLGALAIAAVVLRRRRVERPGNPTHPPPSSLYPSLRPERWLMPGVLLLALALRVALLGAQELRGDEAFGYFLSIKALPDIVRSTLALREPHPVASYVVQHAWLTLAGHSEFAFRFVSAWFGVVAVALLYRLGRRLGLGAATATLAAALMAASPYAIWHSQDARMYTISLALTTASTWLAVEVLRRRRWRHLLAYVLVTWLALHTHYFVAFIVVAQNLFVFGVALVDKPTRRGLGRWVLAQLAVGLLYLPWLVVAADTLTSYPGTGESPGFGEMLWRAFSVFGVGESVPEQQRLIFAVLAGALVLLGAVRLIWSGGQARRTLALLALLLAVPLLATWVSALQRPVFNERYLIAAAPPFFLLAATAVLGIRSFAWLAPSEHAEPPAASRADRAVAWTSAALLAVLAVGALTSLVRSQADPAYSKSGGWRQLAAALDRYSAALPAEQVRLVQNFPDPTLWTYYRGPVEHLVLPPVGNDLAATREEVDKLVSLGVQRIVFPVQPADWWDNSGIARQALSQRYVLLATSQAGGWPVEIYAQAPAELAPVDVTLSPSGGARAGSITLRGASVPARSLAPGDLLDVTLKWEGSAEALGGSEKATLQLVDSAGRLVTQRDQPLSAADLGASATVYPLEIPWLLPPGEYRLIAAVYDPSQPGAPRFVTDSGADYVELAVLRG